MKKDNQKIFVEVHGRLGNQLFQYAFARSIAQKTGGKIYMNFHYLDLQAKKQPNEKGWEDSLQGFQVNYEKTELSVLTGLQKMIIRLGKVLKTQGRFRRLRHSDFEALPAWAKAFTKFSRRHSVYQFPNRSLPYQSGKEETVFLQAFFEDEARVRDVRPILLKEFVPKGPLLAQNVELMRVIQAENSVCVTIRRGDFVGRSQLFLCDEAYFLRGIEEIKKRVKNPVFIFFSDDLEYAADFAKRALADETYFVETPDNPVWEKLRLMRACKHFIISNSTFSWWAQYLGEDEDKIVIGPKRWMPGAPENQAPVMESWIKFD